MHGGQIVAQFLKAQEVPFLFTLSGGHISPILVGCKQNNIRVVDVRDEGNAAFAADAVSRLSGTPGVAAVTAGPGISNTITAVKNAQMAQSPLILLGGATATVLKGRGSLQDIDQLSMIKPHVKFAIAVKKVKQIIPALQSAFYIAQEGVPGPVFVELPVDLLYDEKTVREWYQESVPKSNSLKAKFIKWYLQRHLNKLFDNVQKLAQDVTKVKKIRPDYKTASDAKITKLAETVAAAQQPVMIIGSQVMLRPSRVKELKEAIEKLNVPVYLTGMARGLLGRNHPLQLRHNRKNALKQADLIVLAGVPCDFRLNYGAHLSSKAVHVAINLSKEDAYKNKRPNLTLIADCCDTLIRLAKLCQAPADKVKQWVGGLKQADQKRDDDIKKMAQQKMKLVNPMQLFFELDAQLGDNTIFIVDGGDFVATGSYIINPRQPLGWLDPGVFGTLGVGGGFALGAKLVFPKKNVVIIYGDGSAGYSLVEYDTFVRHKLNITSIIGNDASWAQIARDQVAILDDDVATVLSYSDYHKAVEAFGARGFKIDKAAQIKTTLKKALQSSAKSPTVVNVMINKTEFRKGSISI